MSDMVSFNGVRCTFEEWARLESEYKGKLDLQTKLVDAKREGRQGGRVEGRQEERNDILELIAKGYTAADIKKELQDRQCEDRNRV